MAMVAYQQSIFDLGVKMASLDPRMEQLKKQLEGFTGSENIPHITFMIDIEERVLKLQRGEHIQRCMNRLALYKEKLIEIRNKN